MNTFKINPRLERHLIDHMKRSYGKLPIPFGTPGTWHCPASETTKAKEMRAVVLEQVKDGLLYLFTEKPIIGSDTLINRTVTVFPSDFTPDV